MFKRQVSSVHPGLPNETGVAGTRIVQLGLLDFPKDIEPPPIPPPMASYHTVSIQGCSTVEWIFATF